MRLYVASRPEGLVPRRTNDASRMTAEMEAGAASRNGRTAKPRLDRIPMPAAETAQVLVRLRAAALNHRDVFHHRRTLSEYPDAGSLGADGPAKSKQSVPAASDGRWRRIVIDRC